MVSVVVVNFNGERYLGECLAAVLAQEPAPLEVIVVDNQSEDASLELVATRFPQVQVVAAGANLGPGAARNRGVRAARHDRVLCVDNDVVLQPGVLAELGRVLDSDPTTAMVQARSVLAADPQIVHYDAADVHYLGLLVLHNWYRRRDSAVAIERPVSGGVGLCFLVRKAAFVAVDGFYEAMFFFFEDTEFALRLNLRGYRVRVAPNAIVLHRGGTAGLSMRGQGASYPQRRTFLHSRNRWILLLTCLHWRTLMLTLPAQVAYGCVHLAFALRQGHFLAWWRGKFDLCRMLPDVLRRRRQAQRGRVVRDRALLVAGPFTFNPQIARRGLGAQARRLLDVCFITYWRCVGWACG